MKSTTTILFLLTFISLTSFTAKVDSGIVFEHGRYTQARKLARETNKTIFIDSYTQWCGPCKKMASQVFTDSEVGNYFNKNFINVKMDMEESEGILFGRRYSVNFYPTLLFVKPSGELIKKEVGYQTKAQLMKLARDVNY
jgi:thioredoxin-related protein